MKKLAGSEKCSPANQRLVDHDELLNYTAINVTRGEKLESFLNRLDTLIG